MEIDLIYCRTNKQKDKLINMLLITSIYNHDNKALFQRLNETILYLMSAKY